jgi:hypothetical protein
MATWNHCVGQAFPHGFTAFLPQLTAAAELVVINLVAQHDPKSDTEFPRCRDSRFGHSFLYQFALIETFDRNVSDPDLLGRRVSRASHHK